MPDKIKVPCILGPTGAGKTAAALKLCAEFNGSVINADSRQVYKDFPIITAQPSPEEQSQAPHHFYGFLPTEEKLGAGEYCRKVNPLIKKIQAEGKMPILVGGTGLYIKSLFEGMAPIPDIPAKIHDQWQERLKLEGSPALHALLGKSDPEYAQKIHPNDRQRVCRALEVYESTGKTFTHWHKKEVPDSDFEAIYIGIALDLRELEPLLEKRIKIMLSLGALDEAQKAIKKCNDQKSPGWSGIGCAEIYKHLKGEICLEECCNLWLKSTRAYAKRQLTWFRAKKEIHWFKPGQVEEILGYLTEKINIP